VEEIVGTAVPIIDPAPAIARQTGVVLRQNNLLAEAAQPGSMRFITSGSAERYAQQVEQLLDLREVAVETAVWHGDALSLDS
jgi:glutamate racemase